MGTELTDQGELYLAACAALQLLQDRQQHTQQDMLDPRERRVLKMLRDAIRVAHGETAKGGGVWK